MTEEDEVPMLTITLENDTEVECIVLNVFEFKERKYIAVIPADEDTELEDEIHLFRYSEDGDYIDLEEIEDDLELEEVSNYFYEEIDSLELEEELE